MTIETKYNIGDKVWVIYKTSVVEATIIQFKIDPFEGNVNYPIDIFISYVIKTSLGTIFNHENNLFWKQSLIFKTKEELIASL